MLNMVMSTDMTTEKKPETEYNARYIIQCLYPCMNLSRVSY
jgi:hypothetical protein